MRSSNNSVKQSPLLAIGKVVGAHGIRGDVRIHFYAGPDRSISPETRRTISSPGEIERHVVVRDARPHKGLIRVSFNNVDSRTDAEALTGAEVVVRRDELPDLEDDTYYWVDLIGLEVVTTDRRHLGRIESILPTGSNDVYVVRGHGKETMVPALASVVLEVDLENRIMRVDLPEGL